MAKKTAAKKSSASPAKKKTPVKAKAVAKPAAKVAPKPVVKAAPVKAKPLEKPAEKPRLLKAQPKIETPAKSIDAAEPKAEAPSTSKKAAKSPKPPKAPKPAASKVGRKAKPQMLGNNQLGPSPENTKKWEDFKRVHGEAKAPTYSMTGQFEAAQPLTHKTLGWGYIVGNNNDRLEVLFESGLKVLISNYKPTA
jgi:hypothetical protein